MDLFYKKYGKKGRPFIIIHGVFGMLDNWHSLATQMGKQFQVYAVDLRNHGHSPHSPVMNYEVMANDLKELIDQLKLDNVILLGHSMGGKVAMQFASMFPEKLSNLIVADIAPKRYKPGHHEIIKALKSLDFSKIKSRSQAQKELSKDLQDLGVIYFLLKNLIRNDDGSYGLKMNLSAIENAYDVIIGEINFHWPLNIPTLFLKGENSRYISELDEVEIEQWFTDVTFDSVRNAGHWLHADNPKEFLEKVESFLN